MATLRKRRHVAGATKVKTGRILDLVKRLTTGLPGQAARRLRKRLIRVLIKSHTVDHKPPPEWVRELRRHLQNSKG